VYGTDIRKLKIGTPCTGTTVSGTSKVPSIWSYGDYCELCSSRFLRQTDNKICFQQISSNFHHNHWIYSRGVNILPMECQFANEWLKDILPSSNPSDILHTRHSVKGWTVSLNFCRFERSDDSVRNLDSTRTTHLIYARLLKVNQVQDKINKHSLTIVGCEPSTCYSHTKNIGESLWRSHFSVLVN